MYVTKHATTQGPLLLNPSPKPNRISNKKVYGLFSDKVIWFCQILRKTTNEIKTENSVVIWLSQN